MRFLNYITEDKETFEADKALKNLKDPDRTLTQEEANKIARTLTKHYIFFGTTTKIILGPGKRKIVKQGSYALGGIISPPRITFGTDSKGKRTKIKNYTITLYDNSLYSLIHELAHIPAEGHGHGDSFKVQLKAIVDLYNKEF
jgi:hypothetical protein